MSYLILYGLFALWVILDGFGRKMGVSALLWAIGILFVGPIALPIYLASRPLKEGEVREGGKAWNILKNFAILWTVVMAVVSVLGMMAAAKSTENLTSDAAMAGAGIGMALGMGLLLAVWFFPTVGAAVLGFLMKKNSIIETGPTGPLIGQAVTSNRLDSWGGVAATAVVGLILIGVTNGSSANPSPAHQVRMEVTMSKYNLLRTGMTYSEAVEIIGKEGEETTRSDIAGYTTVMYEWKNDDGTNMNAMFQNGGLVNKAQFGLQ